MPSTRFLFAILSGVMLTATAAPSAWAQGVFKCAVNGKTVYQAEPCENGKALTIRKGPSADEVKAAQARANDEKFKSGGNDAARRDGQAGLQPVAEKVSCSSLETRYAEAYGRRNRALHATRGDNIDRSSEVQRAEQEISGLVSQIQRSGCKVPN